MKLIEPTMEYDQQIQAYRQEFLAFGGSMDGCGSLRKFERTQDWLDQVESLKKPETTPSHWVPSTQYIFVRESDDKVVGTIQIRHYFNEFLEKYAGSYRIFRMPQRTEEGLCNADAEKRAARMQSARNKKGSDFLRARQ